MCLWWLFLWFFMKKVFFFDLSSSTVSSSVLFFYVKGEVVALVTSFYLDFKTQYHPVQLSVDLVDVCEQLGFFSQW